MIALLVAAWLLVAPAASTTLTARSQENLQHLREGEITSSATVLRNLGSTGHIHNKSGAAEPDLALTDCDHVCDKYVGSGDWPQTAAHDELTPVCQGPPVMGEVVCGATCDGSQLCRQTFLPDCPQQCSEWIDNTLHSINVCMDTQDRYKCSGLQPCNVAGEPHKMQCRQKKIQNCWLMCEGYEKGPMETAHLVSQDDLLVCQIIPPHGGTQDDENWGQCLETPCDQLVHQSTLYEHAMPCLQVLEDCPTVCSADSDTMWDNTTTMCYNEIWGEQENGEGLCKNAVTCGTHAKRCMPIQQNPDYSAADTQQDSFGATTPFSLIQLDREKHLRRLGKQAVAEKEKALGRRLNQGEARAEHQRVRKEAYRNHMLELDQQPKQPPKQNSLMRSARTG